jgi:uncharacterized protein
MIPKLWEDIVVQSYKHNTKLHRIWAHATVIDMNQDAIVIANYRTKVIESNGRFWYTKEPSVTWFFKERWFNVIGIIRTTGIFYYCNIASPYMIDEEALKYIDYDLDVKVAPDYAYSILDRKEYNKHKVKMDYPSDLKKILESELNVLKDMIEKRIGPFEEGIVEKYYQLYLDTAKKVEENEDD